jgi:hypothetical protein
VSFWKREKGKGSGMGKVIIVLVSVLVLLACTSGEDAIPERSFEEMDVERTCQPSHEYDESGRIIRSCYPVGCFRRVYDESGNFVEEVREE